MWLRWIKRLMSGILCVFGANAALIWILRDMLPGTGFTAVLFMGGLLIFWVFYNILPFWDKNHMGIRIGIMMGGRTLCYMSLFGFLAQVIILIVLYPTLLTGGVQALYLTVNMVLALLSWLFMLWNGMIRIFCTSRRLSVKTRLLMCLCMWIPLVNLVVLLYALGLVHGEYDFACYKEGVRSVRAESDLCGTRFPIIMVHGVGFRDLRYFNYWGRIPKELTRYGATIYYGNQEAFGTVVNNSADIRDKILMVLKETGAKKVNLIAHSKGGLDARYVITKLNMGEYVASLTTICTPHHGCRFVDYACKLPDGLYRWIARRFDWIFSKMGDKNPDFYTATRQFSTSSSQLFNEEVPDVPQVYYQSYASKMGDCLSDTLLCLPYCLIKPLEGENDGLVSVNSAMWGKFRGVIANPRHRGISHGDMIDLKREDYRDFDIVETYVGMVSDLKKMGF